LIARASALLVLLIATAAGADVELPPLLGDGMVLQRGRPLPVWGRAAPGEKVVVRIAGRSASGVADEAGRWEVVLPALKVGGPYRLTVKGSRSTPVRRENVLVGEVWICSGQSNMAWPVSRARDAKEEIAASGDRGLRLLTVPRKAADAPVESFSAAWRECGPKTVRGFSAVAYFFGRELRRRLKVPVGLVNTSYGGTPVEAWTSREALEAAAPDALPGYAARKPPHRASCLYHGMIAPLVPYGIRGAIWYQGESNAGRAFRYRTLFPAMIADWRARWGQGDFPFYFVQLANFRARKPEPGESAWAELREAQLLTLKSVPNTGMAVAIDVGGAKDIHPKSKQEVGRRLALWALARDYGKKVVPSGPIYRGHEVEDGRVVIGFDHVGGGFAARPEGKLLGFAIAGADRKFVWAEAEIEGDRVVVRHPDIPEPAAVRYGWADNPAANLANREGLPASPFRTDDWPGVTRGR